MASSQEVFGFTKVWAMTTCGCFEWHRLQLGSSAGVQPRLAAYQLHRLIDQWGRCFDDSKTPTTQEVFPHVPMFPLQLHMDLSGIHRADHSDYTSCFMSFLCVSSSVTYVEVGSPNPWPGSGLNAQWQPS